MEGGDTWIPFQDSLEGGAGLEVRTARHRSPMVTWTASIWTPLWPLP
jgi:hypothetical protein